MPAIRAVDQLTAFFRADRALAGDGLSIREAVAAEELNERTVRRIVARLCAMGYRIETTCDASRKHYRYFYAHGQRALFSAHLQLKQRRPAGWRVEHRR